MSLGFEYLHQKRRCEMLIGGDHVSKDVITLGNCFSMFVYICSHFCFALIGRNLIAQSMGSHRGIGDGIQIPETWFSRPTAWVPQRACPQVIWQLFCLLRSLYALALLSFLESLLNGSQNKLSKSGNVRPHRRGASLPSLDTGNASSKKAGVNS